MNEPAKRGVVIIGTPRSGTTLLRRILDAHPAIACPPETYLLSGAARFLHEESFAQGLKIVAAIRADGDVAKMIEERYSSWDSGVGAEIVRRVVEEGFDLLNKAPRVLGGLNTPMPYAAALEDACLPQPADIVQAIRDMRS